LARDKGVEYMARRRRRDDGPATSDWLLNGIVGMVHGAEQAEIRLGVPVILNVGGFLVTGFVISGQEYFERFSQEVAVGLPDAFGEETKASIIDSFGRLGEIYVSDEEETIEDATLDQYNFVHLRDVQFIHNEGAPIPPEPGMLWRCKLSAVDGFTLGLLLPSYEEGEPDEADPDGAELEE
jgi:hypothetical protein